MSENTMISKIAKAALEVGGKLGVDKRNLEQKYDYISADKILSVCGQALFTQGIVVIPAITKSEQITVDRGNGKSRYDCQVDFLMTVTDGTIPLVSEWRGMGSDYSVPDKAMYKAITSGHKYFLMKLLCIGAGNEDGEHEEEEQPKRRPAAPPPPTTQPVTPPAMSLETAMTATDSKGNLYHTVESDKLSFVATSLRKSLAINGLSQEDHDAKQFKLDAILTILASRQEA